MIYELKVKLAKAWWDVVGGGDTFHTLTQEQHDGMLVAVDEMLEAIQTAGLIVTTKDEYEELARLGL